MKHHYAMAAALAGPAGACVGANAESQPRAALERACEAAAVIRKLLIALSIAAIAHAASAQDVRQGKTASRIAYDVRGSGPVVVLITGSNLDRRMWDREAEWLALRRA